VVHLRSTYRTTRRHAPFMTFALATVAAGAYVLTLMIQIVTQH
jgi:hypothetical protein